MTNGVASDGDDDDDDDDHSNDGCSGRDVVNDDTEYDGDDKMIMIMMMISKGRYGMFDVSIL